MAAPAATFPMESVSVPRLATRTALVMLDMQADFLSESSGALPITEPYGFAGRAATLVGAFRSSGRGPVVWICSVFEAHRTVGQEDIMTADKLLASRGAQAQAQAQAQVQQQRGRRRTTSAEEVDVGADHEAFLSLPVGGGTGSRTGAGGSGGGAGSGNVGGSRRTGAGTVPGASEEKPVCVRPGTTGCELGSQVKDAVAAQDYNFIKSHYSAFSAPEVVQMFRGKFVTAVYLCGSLTNVSVYATAMDAARHGFAITIVEDCCGYRSPIRHSNAIKKLQDLTGCDVVQSEDMMTQLTAPRPETITLPERPKRDAPSSSRRTNPPAKGASQPSSDASPITSKPRAPQPARSSPDAKAQSSRRKESAAGSKETTAAAPAAGEASDARPLQAASRSDNAESPVEKQKGDGEKGQGMDKKGKGKATEESSPSPSRKAAMSDAKTVQRSESAVESEIPAEAKSSVTRGDAGDVATDKDSESKKDVVAPIADDKATPTRKAKSKKHVPPHKDGEMSPDEACGTSASSTTLPLGSLCEGDSRLVVDILPPSLASTAFDVLLDEVAWQTMSHQGGEVPRLVAVQGAVSPKDGSMPVYRHPADESPPCLPFSPTVEAIKKEVEKELGHELNHVLIQLYRTGNDYISEHSDKTLDIVPGSYIANVSLGAQRTMILRTKRADKDYVAARDATAGAKAVSERTAAEDGETAKVVEPVKSGSESTSAASPEAKGTTADSTTTTTATLSTSAPSTPSKDSATPENASELQPTAPATTTPSTQRTIVRVPLPHNSLFRLGLRSNARWLHSIRADKRAARDKSPPALANDGRRISLTFRQIGTFLSPDEGWIWGQGARTCKVRPEVAETKEEAKEMEKEEVEAENGKEKEEEEDGDEDDEADTEANTPAKAKTTAEVTAKTAIKATAKVITKAITRPPPSPSLHDSADTDFSWAGRVVNGQSEEAVTMLRAFGAENHSAAVPFDWQRTYGQGFDVLHMGGPHPRVFAGDDAVANEAVAAFLAACGMGWAKGSVGGVMPGRKRWETGGMGSKNEAEGHRIRFMDTDEARTMTTGARDVLLYLQKTHGARLRERAAALRRPSSADSETDLAGNEAAKAIATGASKTEAAEKPSADEDATKVQTRLDEAFALLEQFRGGGAEAKGKQTWRTARDKLTRYLAENDDGFVAGTGYPTVADFALRSVLDLIDEAQPEGAKVDKDGRDEEAEREKDGGEENGESSQTLPAYWRELLDSLENEAKRL